jgi:hypothetical protein
MDKAQIDNRKVIEGYYEMILQRTSAGWAPFLLTFMYKPLTGQLQMVDEIDRVYSTFVTRVVRKPNSPMGRSKRPLLIAGPDGFCIKREKPAREEMAVNQFNGGRHYHGVLVVPPSSRLKQNVPDHFAKAATRYVKKRLLRLDVKPIDGNLTFVVDYALKGLKSGIASNDDIRIFPKAVTERSNK